MLLKFLWGYQPDATHTKKDGIRADVPKAFGASMIRHQEYFHGHLMILMMVDEDMEKEEMQEMGQALCEAEWP